MLLARILIGKYCPNEDFLTVSEKSDISHSWRGILIGRDINMSNAGWEVGNGESINIWDTPWLSVDNPERPMGPAPSEFWSLTVSDLFLPDSREWNVDTIRLVLPFEEQKISFFKPNVSRAPDKLSWLGASSENYSTKSGYVPAISKRSDVMDIAQEDLSFNWKRKFGASRHHQRQSFSHGKLFTEQSRQEKHYGPQPLGTPSNCVVIKSDAAWNENLNIAGLGWTVDSQNRISSFSVSAHHACKNTVSSWSTRATGSNLEMRGAQSGANQMWIWLPSLVSMGSWLIFKIWLHLLNVSPLFWSLDWEM